MTDTSNVEADNLNGADGNQPSVSQGSGNSIAGAPQSSQEFLQLRKELDLTRSELKGLQSRQDKTQNETQRFMEDVKAHVAKGLSLDEAEKAVNADRKAAEKDDLLYQIAQKVGVLGNSPQNVAGNNDNVAEDVAKVFEKYGVANDPVALERFSSLKGLELKASLADYALEKKNQPTPDSSTAGSLQSGPPAPKPGVEKLTEEYKDKMRALRGKPKELAATRELYKGKGVDVYNIDFS